MTARLSAFVAGGFIVLTAMTARGAGDYLIDVKTREDGLPNSSVTGIAQTPDGYLWVGTYNGLARFDGTRFVTFAPDNTPEMRVARVRRLACDPGGTLWISTYDGSLTSYRDGRFKLEWRGNSVLEAGFSLISTRSNRPVFLAQTGELLRKLAIPDGTNEWELLRPPGAGAGELCAAAGDGTIWCRARDQKIWRLVGDTFEPVPTNGLLGQTIGSLVADPRGRIWVGTDREIAVWDGTRFQTMTPTNGEAMINTALLQFMPNGDAWVFANERVRKVREREWLLEVELCRGVFTGWRERTGIFEDAAGGTWIYDYGKGLFHIRADGRTRQLTVEDNFPGERVDCFYGDREGNLWAGVDRGGLVRVREKRFAVLSPGDSAVLSVAEDSEHNVWVGTFGGGLHRWTDGAWQTFSLPGGTRRGFVFSVFPGTEGRIWVSAGEEDLYLGRNGKFEPSNPPVHGVKTLLQAQDGRLWIGTKSGLGCLTGSQFRQFNPEDGVQRFDIRALAEDVDGVVWAGSGDGTLYRIQTNQVQSFRSQDAWGEQPIWSLLADVNGTVWVGTFRGGLMRFRDGKFVRYTSREGLPDDVISQILDDGSGRLWLGSHQGIFHISKAELNAFARGETKTINCTAYGRYDGLPSLECSGSYQPAAWRTGDGRLLFSTLKGVVAVHPEELSPNKLPPPVAIEEVLVDGQLSSPKGKKRSGVEILVPPGKRQVEFRYAGLSLVSPDRVRFRYQLEGLDRDWIEAGTRRWAQYSFLRHGHYKFRVIACNNDGVWNERGVTLAVTVLPHFYETWWFTVLAVASVIGAVVIAVRQTVVRKMRRKLEHLERQRAVERDRARIAKDIHDDLGAGLTHISLLTELARRDSPEEVHNHVGSISDMARELTRTMDEIVWAVDPQNDTLDSLVTYVSKFAQDYLTVAGIRCRLDLPAELPPYTLPAEVRHNLFLAVKETLNNIVKHARASEVRLRLTLEPGAFVVSIEDNGRGIPAPGDNRGEDGRDGRISAGRGLGNLEKRLEASGGRCVIASEPGRGTRVEMMVNLAMRSSPELATGGGVRKD